MTIIFFKTPYVEVTSPDTPQLLENMYDGILTFTKNNGPSTNKNDNMTQDY